MLAIRLLLLAIFVAIAYFGSQIIGWWIILPLWIGCGIIDVSRHKNLSPQLMKNYFIGKGTLTWILAPLNLFADLISAPNTHVLSVSSFPKPYQDEIKDVLAQFDQHKKQIKKRFKADAKSSRTMLFFSWYGQAMDKSIPILSKKYNYIKTIGVSTFKPHQKTSWHFGPLRMSFRILYNLEPSTSPEAFIQVQNTKHLWRDSPLFIFDDTLLHQSVNNTDQTRYCAFIDIVRPSYFHQLIASIMINIGKIIKSYRGLFYKNWDML